MSRYTYSRGQWIDGNELPEWPEPEDFRAYLDRIGYRPTPLVIGKEAWSSVELYESRDGATFYANVSPFGNQCFEVFVPDFPSLMMFIKEFAPAFAAINIESDQRGLIRSFDKLFRATHGHDVHSICRECAPEEWEARVRERRKREEVEAT